MADFIDKLRSEFVTQDNNFGAPNISVDELLHQVAHDPLTKISSRRELEKTYNEIFRKNEIACMLYVDIDRFKSINDNHGHPAGDQVLEILGERLKSHIKEGDFVAREGGEEFVILLRNFGDLSVAEKRANQLREEIKEKKFKLSDGTVLNNTISIGVSVREKDEPLDLWRKRTDEALYQAKAAGRNRVVVAE